MISETAFFVKDVMSPNGSVSIVMDEKAKSDDIDTHTQTQRIKLHRAKTNADGQFASADELFSMQGEPDHQKLCDLEQAYFLKAIRDDIDLSRHMEDAIRSLAYAWRQTRAFEPATRSNSEHHPALRHAAK